MAGWGTTTAISSGKDIYIHYAAPEFAFALANDARSKAAVLYAEPGGHYELEANFNKPVVACVVGRWKAKLTRPSATPGPWRAATMTPAPRTVVHGEVRRRWHLHAGEPGFLRARRRGDQHRPHTGGVDRSDAGERHPARLRTRGKLGAQALVRRQPGASHCRPRSISRSSRRSLPTMSRSASSTDRSARCSPGSR